MNSPSLPESSSPPPFGDANACRQWLKTLPLTNIPLAHATLTTQLELLNRAHIAPLERLKIREQLRDPIAFVQSETARKFLGKPLPLEVAQRNAWNSVISLWVTLESAYRLSLQAALEGHPDVAEHIALITHRCQRYTCLQMMEHYRAYREIGKGLWQKTHELYALAEQRGYAMNMVRDKLNLQSDATTCCAAYAQILLTDLADPYRLTPKQLALLDRWLDKWAVRVTVTSMPPENSTLSLVGVDLDGASPPIIARGNQSLAKPRYLDTERIAATFRKRIKKIRQGEDPAAMGLGEGCIQPDCENLLSTLYQHWCEPAPQARDFKRRPGVDKAQVTFGMAAIHFFSGSEKPFKQPDEKGKLSKREIEDLQLFGRISEKTEKLHISQLGFGLETWQIQDESALGFRLVRPDGVEGMRVGLKQLVGVRPADSNAYALGAIQWLTFPPDGGLHAGIRILPGVPLAIAARPMLLMADAANKYVQAFLLPDMPVLKETASLVLPPGWFSPDRLIEIHTDEELVTVRLHALLETGSDYERAGFVRV